MKFLCKYNGGSHLYGLNTPQSDIDIRGVFCNTDLSTVIGLDRFEHLDKKGAEDVFYFELRHFLNLLRKTNTQVVECIYAPLGAFTELDQDFLQYVIYYKEKLLDSERFYKSLLGYIQGETRLMNGERTGTLGGKRKEALEKYGYSPKNAVQLLRLCYAGVKFFERGYYPVNIAIDNNEFHGLLMDIKLHPEKHTKIELNERVEEAQIKLVAAFGARIKTYTFDKDYADWLCLKFYGPIISKLIAQKRMLHSQKTSHNTILSRCIV